ncbi:MAG: hypothetical protein A2X25_05355, partial [Chloroflexi bacterium GWB2_49_20]
MTRFEIDLKPVSHITSDAIGIPGQRVFYIQAWQEDRPQPITLIVDKIQLQSLAIGVEKLMADLEREKPDLSQAQTDYDQELMRISPPVDPLFRAGEIGLGYDGEADMVIILAREILAEGAQIDESSVARFWCTRTQVRRMARWSQEVINRGRPLCAQCGQPMETEGHFCP